MTNEETRLVCYEFAAQFPTTAVLKAIDLAETGKVAWDRLEQLFTKSLRLALNEVS